jgi:hypothetical protein
MGYTVSPIEHMNGENISVGTSVTRNGWGTEHSRLSRTDLTLRKSELLDVLADPEIP